MNDLKRKLRADDVRSGGNDGFVLIAESCGCGLSDAWPCGEGPYPDCETARSIEIRDEYEASQFDTAVIGDTIYVPASQYAKGDIFK